MKKQEILLQLKEAKEIINRCIVSLGADKVISLMSRKAIAVTTKSNNIDFTLNERNFVKTYGKNMNGQKKFVLLLAYIAKGKTDVDVEIGTVQSKWGKMTAKELLGYSYNDKYPTAAKTNGWIDSKKYGTYHLRITWIEIFS